MVSIPKIFTQDDPESRLFTLPLLPLRDIVVFPHMVAPLFVGRTKSVNALENAMSNDKRVFLAAQKKASVDNPSESDINQIGVVGSVLQLLRLPDGTVKALVEGKSRARIHRFLSNEDFFQVELEAMVEPLRKDAEIVGVGDARPPQSAGERNLSQTIDSRSTNLVSALVDSMACRAGIP